MYEEVKLQRETIKDLEKQILVYKTTRADSRRERCVSVQKMERSASPLINVPKLDLSKIKSYEKSHQ
jgi:hypothetical protein